MRENAFFSFTFMPMDGEGTIFHEKREDGFLATIPPPRRLLGALKVPHLFLLHRRRRRRRRRMLFMRDKHLERGSF